MVAEISARVYTGTDAATESDPVVGLDFISADNAVSSIANRTQYPIIAGDPSYSKWVRLKLDTAPANEISNIAYWSTGETPTGALLRVLEGLTAGVTPSITLINAYGTDADLFSRTSEAKGTWDAGPYTDADDLTDFLVLQLQTDEAGDPGNIETPLFYSYDET